MPVNPTRVKKTGTLGPITKPFTIRFGPHEGQSLNTELTGDINLLLAQAIAAEQQAASGELMVSPVLSKLTSETPIGGIFINGVYIPEYVFDVWEIEANEMSESVFADPRVKNSISYNDRAVIARAIADGSKFPDAIAALAADGLGTFTAPTAGNSLQLYNEMKKGQDAWAPFSYVLRHTSNVSPWSTYNIAENNVNLIYTFAQLMSEVTSSVNWTYPMPVNLQYAINQIPVQYAASDEAAYYQWGWLKKASRRQQCPNFRVDIITEYECGLWSTIRYGLR
jgi:hypothetical protein